MSVNILIPPHEIPTPLLFEMYDLFSLSFNTGHEEKHKQALFFAQKQLQEENRLVYAPEQNSAFIISGGGPISVFRPEAAYNHKAKKGDFETLVQKTFAEKNHPYNIVLNEQPPYREEEYGTKSFWNRLEQEYKNKKTFGFLN